MQKILIVDDQLEVRKLVEATLRIGDFEIIQAASGDEAFAIARIEKPDLILLDVMMPNSTLDGYEICRLLKSSPETHDITIIMLTAKGQEEDREQGFAAGADDYFSKPFSPLELMDKVSEVLAWKKSQIA
ncbi:MAG: response regulator transcription factor [Anaerolineae bacterium]